MSNHSGSYMLNNVISYAQKAGIFDIIGKEKTLAFIYALIKIGVDYDCNDGEILEDIGEVLGICYSCLKETKELEDGLCKDCVEGPR